MVSSKKARKSLSDSDSEHSVSEELHYQRTWPTLKLNLAGSMRRVFAMEVMLSNETENVVCSPVSAMMPLGKLAIGVKGRAASELLEFLGINLQIEVIHKFQSLIHYLQNLPGVKLKMTSRLFVKDKSQVVQKFVNEARFAFLTDIHELDFDDSKKAAENINQYVREKTSNAINEIITPEEIPSRSSILVVNAIAFEAKWKWPFRRSRKLPFYSTKHRKNIRVQMMMNRGNYFYGTSTALNARLVEAQFELDHASMVIVMPNSKTGLGELLRTIKKTPELLNGALKNMTSNEVLLMIPQFKTIETKVDLKNVFKTMGLFHVFEDKSGVTEIIKNKEIKVARAIQKCSFQIFNDRVKGDGAAFLVSSQVSKKEFVFNVDRPSLFYVIMKTLNEQVFVGIINGV